LGCAEKRTCHHRHYETRQEAIRQITTYIEIFYNRQRRQKRLGYLSPAAYEKQFFKKQQAA
jgi:transposase InsO family protein